MLYILPCERMVPIRKFIATAYFAGEIFQRHDLLRTILYFFGLLKTTK